MMDENWQKAKESLIRVRELTNRGEERAHRGMIKRPSWL